MLVKPKEGATQEQQEGMLEAVRQLPQKVGPAVVQLTAGECAVCSDMIPSHSDTKPPTHMVKPCVLHMVSLCIAL